VEDATTLSWSSAAVSEWVEWPSEIFSDTKRRVVSPRQLSYLFWVGLT